MERENEIVEELKALAPVLLDAHGVVPFHVPDNYFDNLPALLLAAVNEPSVPAGIVDPFIVPIGYFDRLPDLLLDKVRAAESIEEDDLAEIAPLLSSINKQPVYAVPEGYFANNAFVPEKAKVVSFKWHRKLTQYVAAAMLASVLITGAYLYTDSRNYKVDDENIIGPVHPSFSEAGSRHDVVLSPGEKTLLESQFGNSVKRNPTFARKVESLSDDELQNYLDENASSESLQLTEEVTEI